VIHTLRPDEPTPTAEPRRYRTTDGYWRLRWKIGPGQYVERLEHRAVVSPGPGEVVHHKNGDPLDNRPENLERLTPSAHMHHHNRPKADPEVVGYLYSTGLSTVEIGARLGMNPATVWRLMHRYGFTTRSLQAHTPHQRELTSASMRRMHASKTPEQRSAIAQKAWATRLARIEDAR
jgi:hypothetical protein